jgi:Polyketide cyclase / dehydrase and lipid transport
MSRKPIWVTSAHDEFTKSFTLPVSPEAIFPLLCPVREYEWIPGWDCEMVFSKSGVAEKGAVFATKVRPFGRMLWTCTAYDPPRRIEYLRTLGSRLSILLELELKPTEVGCEFVWTMKSTYRPFSFGPYRRMRVTEGDFEELINAKERELSDYFGGRRA